MSMINKMMILGVRAFPTEKGETIKFEPPLTLVAGTNGSGKTTIIECLKFVATGQLPPGSKMQGAWIHDPGLDGQREVLAQVKLQFHSADHTRLVATRNMQLSVKKNTRSQKTLEASLLLEKNGQKQVVSSRVAELDAVLPQYLGVSASVLENVIFCHQDDSLWPLAESSVVKKKFDDIFDSAKYTKAIKELGDIRKKHRSDLGRQEVLEQTAKKDRDRSRKVKGRCEQLKGEIDALREEAKELQLKMTEAYTLAQEAWTEAEQHSQVLGELSGYRVEAESKQHTLDELNRNLQPASETDEWLEKTLAQFDATMKLYEADRDAKKQEWIDLKDKLVEMHAQKSKMLSDQGKFEQAEEDHKKNLERRQQMIQDTARHFQLRGFEDLSSKSSIDEFTYRMKKLANERADADSRGRTKADSERSDAQSRVTQLTVQKKAFVDERVNIKKQIAYHDRDARDYQKKIDAFNVDEGTLAVLESRITEIRSRIDTAKQKSQSSNQTEIMKQLRIELRSLEDESDKLNAELRRAANRASETARLSHLKQQLKDKERSLTTLTQAHRARISTLIGTEWTPSILEATYEKCLKDAGKDVVAAEQERDASQRDLDQVQLKLKLTKGELEIRQEQSAKHKKVVEGAIDGNVSEFEELLASAQTRLDVARDQAKGIGGLADWFNKVLETADEHHACRLCERAFKGPDDTNLKRFKNKVEGLIRRASAEESEAELTAAEEDFQQVQRVSTNFDSWKRLSFEDIPTLETEIGKLKKQQDSLVDKLESHDKKVGSRQNAKTELEVLSKPVSSMTRTEQDIVSLKTEVAEASLKQSQQGEVRTLEDIQDEIAATSEKKQKATNAINKLTSDQHMAESERHALEMEQSDLRNELATVTAQLEKKASEEKRLEEMKTLSRKEQEKLGQMDGRVESLDPEIAAAEENLRTVVQKWEGELEELRRAAQISSETVRDLNLLNQGIQLYEDNGGATRLPRVITDIENITKANERLESQHGQLNRDINAVEEKLRDSASTKRHYEDNLRHRNLGRDLEIVWKRIRELESKKAHIDRDRLEAESKKYTDQYHKHDANIAGISREMVTKDTQLKELLQEYTTDLQDAALRYREAHIKFETTKAAIEDIGRYSTALDRAIMKYHSLKMQQVNDIVSDLWKKTYKGSDVDTIYIKSEAEANKTTRTHNYRVVMVKKDIELDMRGRCSAGQRVLACIIIRLALAECFSSGCGVIALDEPTTNLDRDNAEALAESLHEIIREREVQKNFQLIVITHDEQFLKNMRAQEFTDHFYRVFRNQQENSMIERQNIHEVL